MQSTARLPAWCSKGALILLVSSLTILLAACGGSKNRKSNARVVEAVISTGLNESQQATGLVSRVFPTGTQSIYAVLTLEDVAEGTVVSGHWFRLSAAGAPPEGAEASSASVTLAAENIAHSPASGPCASECARVALNLKSDSGALSDGDWVVRIYADSTFIRTMGFVIGDRQATSSPGPAATSAAAPTSVAGASPTVQPGTTPAPASPTVGVAPSPTPTTQTYTVVPGDSLTSVATRFKPANETVESYVARLAALNGVSPNAFLIVGQVLKLPGPQ